ncbi:MAG TPA: BTB/POZ domain-containing protein KCTD2 [Candidatus Bilophila faecipullorum]|uniref:BTB/POZ domain-containing protein KCTD2 n=1 Tax=Candidatus Bilophila faecipullorum TaxID=2838482 RepID=A0A9D1R1J4_9BACT|nr:BTB/POZ domain-containing protein KCTD2 [uncultured Bilophila sp.]HIW79269.1 BTB/POZ domain-containing protein KCTD2 [Candidatus Bilophila faecipullorum]
MKMWIAGTALALTFGMSSLALAACSPEEAQAKALEFSQVLQTKAQKDPNGYAQVMQELQPELTQLQQKQDIDALCAFYDKAIAKLK